MRQDQARAQAKLFREQRADFKSLALQFMDREPAATSRQPSGAVEVASSALQATCTTPQQHPAPQGLPEAAVPALSPAAPVYVPGASKGNLPKHAAVPDGDGPVCSTTAGAVAEGVPNAAVRAKPAVLAHASTTRLPQQSADHGDVVGSAESACPQEQPLVQHLEGFRSSPTQTHTPAVHSTPSGSNRAWVDPYAGLPNPYANVMSMYASMYAPYNPSRPVDGGGGGYSGPPTGHSGPPALGQHSGDLSTLQTPVRAPVAYSTPGYASPSTRFITPASGYNPRRL
jgi:hypothetical protein